MKHSLSYVMSSLPHILVSVDVRLSAVQFGHAQRYPEKDRGSYWHEPWKSHDTPSQAPIEIKMLT